MVPSCGFKSIYNTDDRILECYSQELASIRIKKERKQINQILRNHLEETLNPDNIKTEPKYLLTINLSKSISSTFITSTGASGRNKIILNASYELKDLKSGTIVGSGSVSDKDDFDVEDRRFANYITGE